MFSGKVTNKPDVVRTTIVGLRNVTHRLCRGEAGVREAGRNVAQEVACRYLHHGDPYLGLGPFNLEVVNREPLVAVVRGACSGEEAGRIRGGATGRMKATPLVVAHGQTGERVTHNYTTLRTSKVVYQSEKRYSVLYDTSTRAELVMGVNILGTVLLLGKVEQNNCQSGIKTKCTAPVN